MSVEILSPAGSDESLTAAVRAGADAVYLGAGRFNARRNAANFDDGALAGAVAYCHVRGVKVYLALNTLVSDSERAAALDTARLAAGIGVDGLILQDLGLARLIRKAAPSMPLHASTQMSVHTPAALSELSAMGFRRVVAAREMYEKELEEFCRSAAKLGMEAEVFVHGALCMCVSGQCYLSAMLGGRSGNRGLCAQPCRLPFSVNGGTGHDLSLKDLSLISRTPQLEQMGVVSLKIEGRMKRPEYVAAATAACRLAVDGQPVPESLRDALRSVFSRSGFTDGYFTGRTGREMFGFRTDEDVKSSAGVLSSLHGLYRSERRHIPVRGVFEAAAGRPASLTLDDGIRAVRAEGPVPEPARSHPLSAEQAEAHLKKLGGTCYRMERLDCQIEDGLSLPVSALGALRRSAAERLSEQRGRPAPVPFADAPLIPGASGGGRPALIARFLSPSQIPEDLSGVSAIALPLETRFETLAHPAEMTVYADVPRGLFGLDGWTEQRLAAAKSAGCAAALCGNLSAVSLAKATGLPVIFDFGMNLFNSDSLAAAAGLGGVAGVLSPELTISAARATAGVIPRGVLGYGKLPLMLTRNCPAKNGRDCGGRSALTDRKGVAFPVACRAGCSELYNSRPIWLADRLGECAGLDFLLLYFTDENRAECERILRAYRAGGAPPEKFTRGLYYRGVE